MTEEITLLPAHLSLKLNANETFRLSCEAGCEGTQPTVHSASTNWSGDHITQEASRAEPAGPCVLVPGLLSALVFARF